MEAAVRELAKAMNEVEYEEGDESVTSTEELFESVLTEKLLPILEAGQAMRGGWDYGIPSQHSIPCKQWDAALASLVERES